jgi:hypothetical protein
MASKQIIDHPEILDDGALLLNLTEAAKHIPTRPSRSTVERFVRRGSRGVKLATVMVGGRRYTTATAIRQFFFFLQHTEPEPAQTESRRGSLSKKDIAEACKKYKLPEPLPRQAADK